MRLIRRAPFALATLGPASGVHADFSWELGGLVDRSDASGEQAEAKTDLASMSGTYYFDYVEDGSEPHGLAAFFDPATRVSLVASENRERSELYGVGTSTEVESEISVYSRSGPYLCCLDRGGTPAAVTRAVTLTNREFPADEEIHVGASWFFRPISASSSRCRARTSRAYRARKAWRCE